MPRWKNFLSTFLALLMLEPPCLPGPFSLKRQGPHGVLYLHQQDDIGSVALLLDFFVGRVRVMRVKVFARKDKLLLVDPLLQKRMPPSGGRFRYSSMVSGLSAMELPVACTSTDFEEPPSLMQMAQVPSSSEMLACPSATATVLCCTGT